MRMVFRLFIMASLGTSLSAQNNGEIIFTGRIGPMSERDHSVELQFTADTATITYPELACSGQLIPTYKSSDTLMNQMQNDGGLEFNEVVLGSDCPTNGLLMIVEDGAGGWIVERQGGSTGARSWSGAVERASEPSPESNGTIAAQSAGTVEGLAERLQKIPQDDPVGHIALHDYGQLAGATADLLRILVASSEMIEICRKSVIISDSTMENLITVTDSLKEFSQANDRITTHRFPGGVLADQAGLYYALEAILAAKENRTSAFVKENVILEIRDSLKATGQTGQVQIALIEQSLAFNRNLFTGSVRSSAQSLIKRLSEHRLYVESMHQNVTSNSSNLTDIGCNALGVLRGETDVTTSLLSRFADLLEEIQGETRSASQ